MFAVIYRGSVYPELEQEYLALIDSCLRKTDEGGCVAYCRRQF